MSLVGGGSSRLTHRLVSVASTLQRLVHRRRDVRVQQVEERARGMPSRRSFTGCVERRHVVFARVLDAGDVEAIVAGERFKSIAASATVRVIGPQ